MTDDYTLTQKAIAECIGTFSIVFFGTGAVAIDLMTVPAGIIEANRAAEFTLSGLGHGSLGWLSIAVAFWAAVALPIYMLGHVSGQHTNPSVTLAFWLVDRIETRPAVVYVLAQLAGGIVAALLFVAIRGLPAVAVGDGRDRRVPGGCPVASSTQRGRHRANSRCRRRRILLRQDDTQ